MDRGRAPNGIGHLIILLDVGDGVFPYMHMYTGSTRVIWAWKKGSRVVRLRSNSSLLQIT